MNNNQPEHLLASLGILREFSIGKRISKEEIEKTIKKVKKVCKDKKKFQKLLEDALVENTRKYVNNKLPPGLILPEKHPKQEELDRFYMELSAISHALSEKFVEQKLTKQQVCFIINAIVSILGVTENDFENFHKKFSKYKENDFSDDDSDENV